MTSACQSTRHHVSQGCNQLLQLVTENDSDLIHSKYTSQSQALHTYSITYLLTYLLTYLVTPWSRVLLEKLTGFQLVKEFPAFMEPVGLLPHLQVPATCPYSEPARSSHTTTSHFLKIHLNIILGLPSGLLPSGFPTKTLYTPLLSPIRSTSPVPHSSRFYHTNNIG